jgi:branched-chain amino acid transport system permease protein
MKVTWGRLALVVGAAVFIVISLFAWSGRPVTTDSVISALIVGVSLGSIYAIAASGIVVTYTTSGIFNFAQGAMGMFMAFVYWQLRVSWHLPAPIAIVLAVLVIAPLLGALIERVLMRHIVDATLVVQLTVTVGLMIFFMGLAVLIWDPAEGRAINFFLGTEGFEVGDTFVLWHRFITICVAIGIALFLRLLLYRSRIGVTMRAVVDNRTLAGLHGARPTRASMLAWALGSSMAAISGILLVPELGLQVEALTLLIINAFAAAIIGRLKSLPLTYAGGILLGLLVSYQQSFLDFTGRWSTATFAIPTIVLFVALLALPQARIEMRKPPPPAKILQPRVTRVWETAIGMAVLWVIIFLVTSDMGSVSLNRVTLAIVTATVMLSLVPLTGWAGQVSFAQITFAGVGAFAMFKWAGDGEVWGLLLAAALAVPFGVLVALPALRLQGLYLALATIAFAFMAERLFFDQPEIFGAGAGNRIERLDVFGYQFTDQRAYLLLVTAIFGAMAVGVIALRRSAYGRRLVALRDSEAACATLGVNRMTTKLSVFALSAAMAGFGGALLGMQRGTAGTQDFTMLIGLPIVLLVVVGGVATVAGALIGGFSFILFRVISDTFDSALLRSLELIGPGFLALNIATNPNGAAVILGFFYAPVLPWRTDARQQLKADILQDRQVAMRFGGGHGFFFGVVLAVFLGLMVFDSVVLMFVLFFAGMAAGIVMGLVLERTIRRNAPPAAPQPAVAAAVGADATAPTSPSAPEPVLTGEEQQP